MILDYANLIAHPRQRTGRTKITFESSMGINQRAGSWLFYSPELADSNEQYRQQAADILQGLSEEVVDVQLFVEGQTVTLGDIDSGRLMPCRATGGNSLIDVDCRTANEHRGFFDVPVTDAVPWDEFKAKLVYVPPRHQGFRQHLVATAASPTLASALIDLDILDQTAEQKLINTLNSETFLTVNAILANDKLTLLKKIETLIEKILAPVLEHGRGRIDFLGCEGVTGITHRGRLKAPDFSEKIILMSIG